mgnify:FL=1
MSAFYPLCSSVQNRQFRRTVLSSAGIEEQSGHAWVCDSAAPLAEYKPAPAEGGKTDCLS